MSEPLLRRLVIGQFVALIVLGLAWELWLAPLRPGAWMLALKVLPLVLALPGLLRGQIRIYQWWSMVVMIYLMEGLVRGASDGGLSATLGWIEAVLAAGAFGAILLYVRGRRLAAQPPGP
jgi:uncharacterized membrane protein